MLYYDDAFKHTKTKPFTMGHEGGEMIALGASVPSPFHNYLNTEPIRRYSCSESVPPFLLSVQYVINMNNVCIQYFLHGLGLNVVYARVVVPVNATVEETSPLLATVSINAVLTSYHTLKDLRAGETVLIVGLGINTLQIDKFAVNFRLVVLCILIFQSMQYIKGAQAVIAVDTRKDMLQKALKNNSDRTVSILQSFYPNEVSSFD
ncbi:hypothetical protein GGU11DRAFT_879658 [Lentinula aff. detonsa]|nr:hypothetical protein GGU11DRAFT_879658 [Lentinula aff. detonsa]